MRQILYILSTIFLALACDGKKEPDPVVPDEPEVFKNTFVLMGEAFCPKHKLWQKEDSLSVWSVADGSWVGSAAISNGEGTASGTWTLKTNAEAGTRSRIFYPVGASPKGYTLDGSTACAWSDEVTLDEDWPVEFSFHSPLAYLRLVASAPKGSDMYGALLRSVRFTAEGVAIAGAFTPDFEHNAVVPAGDASDKVELTLSEPLAIGPTDSELWMAVFPADLTGRRCEFLCSVTDAKGAAREVTARLEGRKLEAGQSYTIRLQSLGGLMTPADHSKAEYSPVRIAYKVMGTDASYLSGEQITLDSMNWMDKYNTNPCDRWGGLPGVTPDEVVSANPAGFWRVGKKQGRYVMVDPDGNIALLHGMNGVEPDILKEATSTPGQREFAKRFGTDYVGWASWAGKLLADAGFNFYSTNTKQVSAYSAVITTGVEDALHAPQEDKQLGQAELAFLLRTFRNNYYTASHSGKGFDDYELNVLALVFDPYYLDYIDGIARQCAAISKGKKNFIGWYLDNELQFRWDNDSKPGVYLRDWLRLEGGPDHCQAGPYARAFAESFMREKYGVEPLVENVTEEMEDAFLLEVCRYYYRTASEAIRRHDPDHLILGSRLHGRPRQLPQVAQACSEYCDVVSFNIYAMWVPQDSYFVDLYSQWVARWDRPFMVSEFYIRDATATYDGKPYSSTGEGGGWYVKGQEDRGRFYQGYTRKLTSYRNCVGWEWFQMTDDYAESYNGWNNKGIVDPHYEPYEAALGYMRRHNWNIYQILNYYFPGIAQGASTEDIPGAVWDN